MPDCECFVVVMLNTHRPVKGHYLVSICTMDTILVHPREVLRAVVIAGASAIILMHNHPSGKPKKRRMRRPDDGRHSLPSYLLATMAGAQAESFLPS